MKRKHFIIMVALTLLCSDILLVARAGFVCRSYSPDRFILEGKLHYRSFFSNVNEPFDSRIIFINGKPVDGSASILSRIGEIETGDITYLSGNQQSTVSFGKKFNVDLFAFIMMILLCANIHAVWAGVIRYKFESQYSGRIFSSYSFGIGLVFLAFVHYLLYQQTSIPVIAASSFAAYMILKAGMYLFGSPDQGLMPLRSRRMDESDSEPLTAVAIDEKQPQALKRPKPYLFIGMTGFTLIPVIYSLVISDKLGLFIGFSTIVSAGFFAVVAATIRLLMNRKISRKTGIIAIFGTIVSMLVPFIIFAAGLYADLIVPISFAASLTIIIPLVLANNTAEDNIRYSFSIKKRYLLRMIVDLVTAVIITGGIFVGIINYTRNINGEFALIITAVCVVSALSIRKLIIDAVRKGNPVYRDIFADAVRRVSEISALPAEFVNKINQIEAIIREITGIGYFHIELFEMSIVNRIDESHPLISYSRGSAVEQYISQNPYLISRNSFFSGSVFEILGVNDARIDLIAPIRSEGYAIGVMLAGDKENDQPLADDEITFFNSLSVVLYQLIENEILFREYLLKREYEREIDIASYIQLRLFPKRFPMGRGFQIAHYGRPYLKVTGDYYDFIDIDDKRTLIAIGDVAGHGLSAATILAVVGNIIHAMIREGRPINDLMNELNHFFAARYRGTELMTLFLLDFNGHDKTVSYINAGHCEPLFFRSGTVTPGILDKKSPILGADRAVRYGKSAVTFESGDKIILYTDGIIEIQSDQQGNNVGDRILLDAAEESRDLDIDQTISAFAGQIEKFPRNAIHDDITVIGIKVL